MEKIVKKVVFINQTLGIGGAEQFAEDLLVGLEKKGIQIEAYVTHPTFKKQLSSAGLKTHQIPVVIDIIGDWKGLLKAIFLFPKALIIYWSIIRQLQPKDVILLSGFPEKIIISLFARWRGNPVIWVEYGPLSSVFQKFARLPFALYSLVTAVPQHIIAPSENTKRDLVKNIPNVASKLQVIPCGRPVPAKYSQAVRQHRIVCVSRMEKGKGQDILVQAFAQIVKKHSDAELLLVGEGDFDRKVKQLVQELELEQQVRFLGRVSDPLAIMAEAHVCVFPSVWELEGFGLVTIEAMSLAKPIVAFRTGPTPEIITDGETGLLAEEGNSAELAEKIITILENPGLATYLGKQARQEFEKRYTIDRTVEQYLQVIENSLS